MDLDVAALETNELQLYGHNVHPDPEVPKIHNRPASKQNRCEYIQTVLGFEPLSLQKKYVLSYTANILAVLTTVDVCVTFPVAV